MYSEVKVLDHIVIVLIFGGTTTQFSTVAIPFYISTAKGSNFFTSSAALIIFCFCYFGNSHPNACKEVSHCDSDLHFPID